MLYPTTPPAGPERIDLIGFESINDCIPVSVESIDRAEASVAHHERDLHVFDAFVKPRDETLHIL
jgi:hypothetical protein